MLIDEIYTQINGLVSGYTVDKGFMADDTDQRIAIYEYTGFASELGFGVAGVQYEHPGLQIVVRGAATDYAGPRTAIETIYRNLPQVQATTLSGVRYHLIQPRQAPFFLRRDEKDRVLLAVNFMVTKEPS